MADKSAQPVKIINSKFQNQSTVIRGAMMMANAYRKLLNDPKCEDRANVERDLRAVLALKDRADKAYKKAII